MAKKTKTYSKELKLKAVRMYIEEGLGSTAIAKEQFYNQKSR
ncbi:transposase [Clostridium botulinum]|nr:transposase [Clostridium botulinum]